MYTSHYTVDIPSISVLDWLFGGAFNALPPTPVLIDADNPLRWLSLATYRVWSKRLGLGLAKHGLRKGKCVLCYANGTLAHQVAMMGTIASGAYFVAPRTSATEERQVEILEMVRPSIVLVERYLLESVTAAVERAREECRPRSIWIIDDDLFDSGLTPPYDNEANNWKHLMSPLAEAIAFDWSLAHCTDLDQIVFLKFTSGSTGKPKHIVHTHRSMVSALCSLRDLCNRDPRYQSKDDPVRHLIISREDGDKTRPRRHSLFLWPSLGIETYVMAECSPAKVLAAMERYRITDLSTNIPFLVDLEIEACTSCMKYDHTALRAVHTIGGGLGVRALDLLRSLWPDGRIMLQDKYGSSETGGVMSDIPSMRCVKPASVGKLLANCEARLLDIDSGKPVPEGTPGVLWLRTPGICKGFLTNSGDITPVDLEGGWYNTDDIAYVDEANNWFIMCRRADILRLNDQLLSPLEIEAWLLEKFGVNEAAVVAVTKDKTYHIWAFVVMDTGHLDIKSLKSALQAKLKALRCIVAVRAIPRIPKVEMAKAHRHLLRNMIYSELCGCD